MIERLLQTWRGMVPRERRMVALAAAVLLLAVIYLLLLEPAWQGRRKLIGELPQQRAQLAQVAALAEEARRLETLPASFDSIQALRNALERSIAAAGMAPQLARLDVSDGLFELRFNGVPHARWLDWLDTTLRETRLRVATVSLTREPAPGMVAVRLVLEAPASAER